MGLCANPFKTLDNGLSRPGQKFYLPPGMCRRADNENMLSCRGSMLKSVDTYTHRHVHTAQSFTTSDYECMAQSTHAEYPRSRHCGYAAQTLDSAPPPPPHARTHTHTHTHARAHARTHARTRTHAHARHARTHVHTAQSFTASDYECMAHIALDSPGRH